MSPKKPNRAVLPTGTLLAKAWEAFRLRRPRYSLRALSRDTKISSSYLSKIFRNLQAPSHAVLLSLSEKLALTKKQREEIFQSALYFSLPDEKSREIFLKNQTRKQVDSHELQPQHYNLLRSWINVAILDLSTCADFKSNTSWVAKRLGISEQEASKSIAELFLLGLLKNEEGNWKKAELDLELLPKQSLAEVRSFHGQMIGKSLEHLKEEGEKNYDRRLITGLTLAANMEHLNSVREKINELLRESWAEFSQGDCTEVYQLNVQLFPLTKNSGIAAK